MGISLLCLLFEKNNRLAAQTKDTLKEASITGKKIVSGDLKLNEFAPGEYSMQIDSTTLKQYKMQNLSTLLTQQTPVFVKSYSFNGLATLNFRGASAAQSQVYWNGVPIQNAALGVADISTLPVLFLSKVNLVYGGSAALWGSGNVGGALLLEEAKPFFDSGRKALSVSLAAGSYSQYSAGLEAMLSTKKWYFSLKGLGQTALNDFTYTTETGSKQEMPNSTLKSGSILLNTAYKINDYNTIAFSGWYQQYARAIPPALFETYSDKQQKDGSTRMLLTWNRNKNKGSEWYAKASFIKDDIRYDDSSILLHTTNTSYQYYQEIGWRKDFGQPGALLLFMPVQVAWMNQQDSTGTH